MRQIIFWQSLRRAIQQRVSVMRRWKFCIFAADAYIRDEAEYTRVMKEAVRAVEETDALVTIGIHPTFPSTGYGYIRSVEEAGKVWRKVEEFVE